MCVCDDIKKDDIERLSIFNPSVAIGHGAFVSQNDSAKMQQAKLTIHETTQNFLKKLY